VKLALALAALLFLSSGALAQQRTACPPVRTRSFPAVNASNPLVSLGIMAAPFGNKEVTSVRAVFAVWLSGLGLDLDSFELKAHPALRYEPRAICSQRRVLFVGDAADVEPLFGEGITSAIVLGTLAAQAAYKAIRRNDFSLPSAEVLEGLIHRTLI
jgi:hypothetical protein